LGFCYSTELDDLVTRTSVSPYQFIVVVCHIYGVTSIPKTFVVGIVAYVAMLNTPAPLLFVLRHILVCHVKTVLLIMCVKRSIAIMLTKSTNSRKYISKVYMKFPTTIIKLSTMIFVLTLQNRPIRTLYIGKSVLIGCIF
jgi:hypothetical protein